MAAQLSRQIYVFISLFNANPFDRRPFSECSAFPLWKLCSFEGRIQTEFSRVQYIARRFYSKAVEASFLHSFEYLWLIFNSIASCSFSTKINREVHKMAAILGIVASLVGPATEIGKCILVPIKRQFSYLCCFSSIAQSLREEADKLEDARSELKMRVTTAENNAEVIVRQVTAWFEKVNEIQMKMREIELEIESGRLSIKSRYSISKKAKKAAQVMKELCDCSSFNHVSQLAPPESTVSVPLGNTSEFESRKHIEDEIITTLKNKNVNILGICGMGGVGKTTMAKRIMNRAREEHLFDEIVMVVVSQQADVLKIQEDIAESLGLTLVDRGLSSRAHKLRFRLMCEKRILIVLDDIWKNLNLDDLGIPCERNLKGCTIVITSRDRDVLRGMSAQKVFVVATLSKVEAWSLFRENIGDCLDDHNLLSSAHEIVKECKGLPLALVTVGVALKDRGEEFIWEDALQQLKSSNPIDMPKVLEDVYKPLRLSYNFLESEHAKSLFLLCCLFPEDAHIPIQHLTFYCWGLRVFEELRNMADARNRVWMLVEMLKNRFLLLDIEMEGFVQMHDVVRDVAIFIASERGLVPKLSLMTWQEENAHNDCTWISSFLGERAELLKEMVLPNLRLLQIDNNRGENFQMNDYFFDGIRGLNVMSITCPSLRRLPHTTHLLKKLRTLVLHRCYCLDSIFVVSELESLEILVCDNCDSIEELPAEMKRLTRLRLLELSLCWKLKTIAPGVISSLVGLEELKMVMCFDKWEPEAMKEGKERKNAGLRELQSLSHLTYLKINVEDSTLAAEEMSLSAKLVKFDIRIGSYYITDFSAERFNKRICLQLTGDISLGHWINTLLRSTECLDSTGDGSNNLELSLAQNIRWLSLKNCSTLKYIAKPVDWSFAVFPQLEWLYLQELDNLEEICSGFISSDSFQKLQYLRLKSLPALKHLWKSGNPYQNGISLCSNLHSIYIYHCDDLRNLFALLAKDCLPQLESLVLESCEMIEQVFMWNTDYKKKGVTFTFPNLKSLVLRYLPRLSVFLKGIESVEFPQLSELLIVGCPKMKSLASYTGHDHDTCLHLLCNPKIAFGKLKEVEISGYEEISNKTLLWCHQISTDFFIGLEKLKIDNCHNIRSLFSSSIAQNLVTLGKLEISSCCEMVKVIEGEEEEEEETPQPVCLFPRLQEVNLVNLPNLGFFCECRFPLELPSLERLWIEKCPKIERFTLGSITTPNLNSVEIDFEPLDAHDLNQVLQLLLEEEIA